MFVQNALRWHPLHLMCSMFLLPPPHSQLAGPTVVAPIPALGQITALAGGISTQTQSHAKQAESRNGDFLCTRVIHFNSSGWCTESFETIVQNFQYIWDIQIISLQIDSETIHDVLSIVSISFGPFKHRHAIKLILPLYRKTIWNRTFGLDSLPWFAFTWFDLYTYSNVNLSPLNTKNIYSL